MENGADGYLSKPFKEAELFRLIHECAGVILEYEDGAECETGAVTEDTADLRDAVASLPEELLRHIHDATAVTADIDRMNDLCEQAAARSTPGGAEAWKWPAARIRGNTQAGEAGRVTLRSGATTP